jgi:hypothetical protein
MIGYRGVVIMPSMLPVAGDTWRRIGALAQLRVNALMLAMRPPKAPVPPVHVPKSGPDSAHNVDQRA